MALISLAVYAQQHNREVSSVRQLAARGGFTTAQKISRNWVIDESEPYPDHRKATMRNSLSRDASEILDHDTRVALVKRENVRRCSAIGAYGDTFARNYARLTPSLLETCTVEQLGQIVDLLYSAYGDGKNS